LAYRPGQAGTVVALGATPTNLVSIRDGLSRWEPDLVHGQWLDYEEVSKAVAMLCALDDAGRAAVVGIEPGRERTLHAGALILERFLQALHVLVCRVTVRGWRHALLERDVD
jgi:exopolyphosphatase / guanosine-5'-triphosphate,3'-diphosphate pyrophosphatase